MVAAPVIFFFEKIRKVFRDTTVLKIAAVSFFIKAVGFYFAGNIQTIYLLQFFQISSYALLVPDQVYYAKEKVRDNDMVKGQAFITAAYALGCAAGNFAGGQLLSQGAGGRCNSYGRYMHGGGWNRNCLCDGNKIRFLFIMQGIYVMIDKYVR